MLRILIAVFVIFLSSVPSHAQPSELAAKLSVIYPGVSLRRANTDVWLPVTQGAEMPFGAGDVVRTDAKGRVFLTFSELGQALILPQTEFQLLAFDPDTPDQPVIHVSFIGRTVYALDSQAVEFQIQTEHASLTAPAEHFAMQIDDQDNLYVLVAEGMVAVTTSQGTVEVPAGNGLRVRQGLPDPMIPLTQPASFAYVEAELDGCDGLAQSSEDPYLNVRTGSGLGYPIIGVIDNNTTIRLVGISNTRDRYRVQFRSGFGWVVTGAVITDCANLTQYPDDWQENAGGVERAEADEVSLLSPFFGFPEEDDWFYPLYQQ